MHPLAQRPDILGRLGLKTSNDGGSGTLQPHFGNTLDVEGLVPARWLRSSKKVVQGTRREPLSSLGIFTVSDTTALLQEYGSTRYTGIYCGSYCSSSSGILNPRHPLVPKAGTPRPHYGGTWMFRVR